MFFRTGKTKKIMMFIARNVSIIIYSDGGVTKDQAWCCINLLIDTKICFVYLIPISYKLTKYCYVYSDLYHSQGFFSQDKTHSENLPNPIKYRENIFHKQQLDAGMNINTNMRAELIVYKLISFFSLD